MLSVWVAVRVDHGWCSIQNPAAVPSPMRAEVSNVPPRQQKEQAKDISVQLTQRSSIHSRDDDDTSDALSQC